MKCNKCGFENKTDSLFCANCGSALNQNIKNDIQQSEQITNLPKSTNRGIFYIIFVGLIIIAGVIGTNYFLSNNDKKNVEVKYESDKEQENNLYSEFTENYPKEKRTLNYYYNINTEEFDENKFDGRILFFDKIVTTKLTGKALKDTGFTFVSKHPIAKYEEIIDMYYDTDCKCYTAAGGFKNNDDIYPQDDLKYIEIFNYNEESLVYSDNTEVQYTTSDYKSGNIVAPYIENKDYAEITIDDVIDTLGVPKYVEYRTEKIDPETNWKFFSYVYVYDDYTFIFNLSSTSLGTSITKISYMGKQTFAQPYSIYSSYTEFLESHYKDYLESISK